MSKKTNRTLTKLVSSALAMMMLLGGVACDQPSSISEVKYGKLSESEVWGAPATEKVLQDVHGIYDAFRTDAAVNVTAARGEYESQHIIITAKDKPLKYALSDRKSVV